MDGDVWRKFYRGFLGLDRYKNNVPPSSDDDRPLRPSDDDENPKNSLRNTPPSLDNFQVFTDPLGNTQGLSTPNTL